MARGSVLCLLAWLAACDAPAPAADTGPPAADAGPALAPPAPEIPWLPAGEPPLDAPRLSPCPPGWREVPPASEDDVATCDPYPVGGALECPPGQAHFPGEPGCAPLGAPCPSGEWADDLPDDGTVLFVRAGEPAGGDGTRARPFGAVADALALASSGQTVALSRGTFTERLVLSRDVTVRGACAEQTILTPVAYVAVRVELATVRVRDLSIRDAAENGIQVEEGATLELDGVAIERPGETALIVWGPATVVARSIHIRGAPGSYLGILVDGASGAPVVDVRRAIIEAIPDTAIQAWNADADLRLADVVIRGTTSEPDFPSQAIAMFGPSTLELTRVLLESNQSRAIDAWGEGATVRMEDAVIRDTLPSADGSGGGGLFGGDGAVVELERVLFDRNRAAALYFDQQDPTTPDARVSLTDVVVRETGDELATRRYGHGVAVRGPVRLAATRLHVVRSREVGIFVEGGTLTLSDVSVLDTLPRQPDGAFGAGLVVQGVVHLARARIARSRVSGITASGPGTSLHLTDVVIRDTQGQESDGTFGRALSVQDGAQGEATRLLVERSREVGVGVLGEGASLALSDAVVRDTSARACADSSCPERGSGVNAGAYAGGALRMSRFVVERAPLCGVQLARGGGMDLARGVVAEHPIGVCLGVPDYDVSRLTDEVLYRENGAIVESVDLVVPDAAPSPSSL